MCEDKLADFNCICPQGFKGDFCEINIDECATIECQNDAICVDKVNGFTCIVSFVYILLFINLYLEDISLYFKIIFSLKPLLFGSLDTWSKFQKLFFFNNVYLGISWTIALTVSGRIRRNIVRNEHKRMWIWSVLESGTMYWRNRLFYVSLISITCNLLYIQFQGLFQVFNYKKKINFTFNYIYTYTTRTQYHIENIEIFFTVNF